MQKDKFWFAKLKYLRMDKESSLISSEKITVEKNIPLHRHDIVETALVVSGSGTTTINGITYPLSRGSFMLLYQYHIHDICTDSSNPLTMYVCSMDFSVQVGTEMDVEAREMIIRLLSDGSPIIQVEAPWFDQLKSIFSLLVDENNSNRPFKYGTMQSLINVLTMHFLRFSYEELERHGTQESHLAWQIFKYIYLNDQQKITSESTAAHFGITVSKMNHLLRTISGLGFSKNLHEARVRNACALMQFRELSLPFIARSLGYSSYSTFYRAFKSVKGLPPEKYMQKNISNNCHTSSPGGDTAWSIFIYMYENYSAKLTPGIVASYFHISESQLNSVINKTFSDSFGGLLASIRITYARSLLSATDMAVCDISAATGFESTRSFNRNFKNIAGMPPSSYRLEYQSNDRKLHQQGNM